MIRVVVVDDHEIVRQGISAILQGDAEIQVVGEAKDGAEALRVVRDTQPDVALVDVRLPRQQRRPRVHPRRSEGVCAEGRGQHRPATEHPRAGAG